MSEILADGIISSLKDKVRSSSIKPGEGLYINLSFIAVGDNSKRLVRAFLPINKSLDLINSVKFIGANIYAIQWDIPWENIHIGSSGDKDITSDNINITPNGLLLHIAFSTDITNTSNPYAKGFITLVGTLVFE